jgi:nucleoid DNA-binding protein
MRVSSRNRPRYRRKHQATPTDHANFNEFLVRAISPGRTGSDKSKWDPDELSRPRAEAVVNVVFDSIAAALKKGEKVTLPIGTFEVLEHTRPPMRRWLLKRVRVTYAKRRYIQFTPAEEWLEEGPAGCGIGPAAVTWRANYLARQKARK